MLREVLSIETRSPSGDYLLGEPAAAVVDRNGELFVADTGGMRILVFDRDGAPVRQIGRRGRGRGPFVWPGTLALAGDDRFIVVDSLRRIMSLWTTRGVLEGEFPLNRGERLAKQVAVLSEDRLLMHYGGTTAVASSDQRDPWFFHIREFGAGSGLAGFGAVETLAASRSEAVRRMNRRAGGVFALSADLLLFSPQCYEGRLFGFHRERDDEWRGPFVVEGCKPAGEAVMPVSEATPAAEMESYAEFVRSVGPDGAFHLGVAHATAGLVAVTSGEFLHFASVRRPEGARSLVVQRFSGSGELLWSGRHEGPLPGSNEGSSGWRVLAVDPSDRVVVSSVHGSWRYPEIRVVAVRAGR